MTELEKRDNAFATVDAIVVASDFLFVDVGLSVNESDPLGHPEWVELAVPWDMSIDDRRTIDGVVIYLLRGGAEPVLSGGPLGMIKMQFENASRHLRAISDGIGELESVSYSVESEEDPDAALELQWRELLRHFDGSGRF